jgi:phage tail-like protein
MTMFPLPVRYAVARAGESWPEVALSGLEADHGGDLHLRLLPGLAPPSLQRPGTAGASGLALDCHCGLYVADGAGSQLTRFGLDCGTELLLPGAAATGGAGILVSPAGICWGPRGWLFVANGDGRILVFTTPELSLRDAWPGFQQPAYLACHKDSVLVVDIGAKRLQRFDWRGQPDIAFNTAVQAPNAPTGPGPVAVAGDGTIYLADRAGGIWPLTWSGGLAGPILARTLQPSALAISGQTLYVADQATGKVVLLGLPGGEELGAVVGFQGPTAALAAGDRTLYIKPGLDGAYLAAPLGSSYGASGALVMGPLDAGQESVWARAGVNHDTPPLTAAELSWFSSDSAAPGPITWQVAPSLDLLIPAERYLWLRVVLSTRTPAASPTLRQVQAQTTGESYIDYLPYVYAHDPDRSGLSKLVVDQSDPSLFEPGDLDYLRLIYARTPVEGGQVGRLLDLARSQLGDLEQQIDDLPRNFDPATAPAGSLDWLASWLAFDLPPRLSDGAHPDQVRKLLLGLWSLYQRRGTPSGVADFVEVYAGVRPHLVEDFRDRPLWILGETALGFGTGMPDRQVEGMLVGEAVVGETGPADPADIGSALFAGTAHRFSVVVPPRHGLDGAARSLITSVLETEKPAHTAFHICFAEPRMRVGLQARVGIDALVSGGEDSMELGSTSVLGVDARLAGPDPGADGAVGRHGQVGIDTRLG